MPLCNPSSDLLCPWSAANFLWSDEISLTKKYSLNQLQVAHNPLSQNLRQLDKSWRSLAPPLVVRVLAKCKERLILQQDNHRKSWMCLTNLLVADNSAYSVLTVWDEAVGAVSSAVREGDILVLAGSYSPAMMSAAHRKLIHNIGPKVRPQGTVLTATQIEIKLNKSDLGRVSLVHNSATCDSVPPLLCHFVTCASLNRGGAAPGRLVDLVGLVTWHGRWERESVRWSPVQSWVRLWLQVMDHTGPEVVSVKMFVDVESWEQLKAALPGEVIILTNLVSVFDEDKFSHLESSNQTGVFSGDSALDSRFGHNAVVRAFRDKLEADLESFSSVLREQGGFGGQFCRGPSVLKDLTALDSNSELCKFDQLIEVISKSIFRGSKRLLIKAKISSIQTFHVNKEGKLELMAVNKEEDEHEKTLKNSIGINTPEVESFKKSLLNLNGKSRLQEAVKYDCYLNLERLVEKPTDVIVQETDICVVSLVMEDCKVISIADPSLIQLLADTAVDHYMLDCFKTRLQGQDDRPWEGMEFVLRQAVFLSAQSSQSQMSQESTADKSILSNTFDIVNALM